MSHCKIITIIFYIFYKDLINFGLPIIVGEMWLWWLVTAIWSATCKTDFIGFRFFVRKTCLQSRENSILSDMFTSTPWYIKITDKSHADSNVLLNRRIGHTRRVMNCNHNGYKIDCFVHLSWVIRLGHL